MKIRYCRQKTKVDCGPTVVINASKFYGAKLSYTKEYKVLCELLDVEETRGTTILDIQDLIEDSNLPFYIKKICKNPKVREIKNHVKSNNCVMLFYSGHVSLITHIEGKKATLINHYTDVTITKLANKDFNKIVRSADRAFLLESNYENKVFRSLQTSR